MDDIRQLTKSVESDIAMIIMEIDKNNDYQHALDYAKQLEENVSDLRIAISDHIRKEHGDNSKECPKCGNEMICYLDLDSDEIKPVWVCSNCNCDHYECEDGSHN